MTGLDLKNRPLRVGVVGGGIAGSTAAIKLAQQGYRVFLLKRNQAWFTDLLFATFMLVATYIAISMISSASTY